MPIGCPRLIDVFVQAIFFGVCRCQAHRFDHFCIVLLLWFVLAHIHEFCEFRKTNLPENLKLRHLLDFWNFSIWHPGSPFSIYSYPGLSENISHVLCSIQRLHRIQIIWVCSDIWVFSVLDNRHLSDIWVICQKCQFEERKGWKALFLQSQEMQYNKQTLPYWNFYFLDPIQILQSCKIFGLSFFVHIWNEYALLSRYGICCKYALFGIFYSDLNHTNAIWLRLYSDIWPKKWWVEPLLQLLFVL